MRSHLSDSGIVRHKCCNVRTIFIKSIRNISFCQTKISQDLTNQVDVINILKMKNPPVPTVDYLLVLISNSSIQLILR